MILITKPTALTKQFLILLGQYPEYYFATAWAGLPEEVSVELLANSGRIKQFVVGIHFYQTDPEFFSRFMHVKGLRAILQPSGTFHPKIFLFFRDKENWALLMGSANLTKAAFSTNTEATIFIDSSSVYIGDSGPSISLEDGPVVSVIPGQQL